MGRLFRFADIQAERPRKGNYDNPLAAIFIIVEAGAREINDDRHKLRSDPVVQAHKQIPAGVIRMTKRHKFRGPVFVGPHSAAAGA
jgi:hypothetical protein